MSYFIPARDWNHAHSIVQKLTGGRENYLFGTGYDYPRPWAVFYRPGLHQLPGYEVWKTKDNKHGTCMFDVVICEAHARQAPSQIIVTDAHEAAALLQRVTGSAYTEKAPYTEPFAVVTHGNSMWAVWRVKDGALDAVYVTIAVGEPALNNDPQTWPKLDPKADAKEA